MGYTQRLGALPDFNKIVVSLWFNASAASIADAAESSGDFFAGMIPLVVFGAKQTEVNFDSSLEDVKVGHGTIPPDFHVMQTVWGETPITGDEIPPCYIALDCTGESPKIAVRIQTKTPPEISGWRLYTDQVDVYDGEQEFEVPPIEGDGIFVLGGLGAQCHDYTDASYVDAANPAGFEIYNDTVTISPDTWNHVLLSFDLSGGCEVTQVSYPNNGPEWPAEQTTASCKCYLAINGVNCIEYDGLGNNWVGGGEPNDILPEKAIDIAWSDHDALFFDLPTDDAIYSMVAPQVGAGVVGVPANSDYASEVIRVRMADLQIFTGVSIDTGNPVNVQAFRKPDGGPQSPAVARDLLGKSPEVRFQRSNDWINGVNRGTAGDFTPTGTINEYDDAP